MSSALRLAHEAEITRSFALSSLFKGYWNDIYDRDIKNYYILFCDGDLRLSRDLSLDWTDKWNTRSAPWLKDIFGITDSLDKDIAIAALVVLGDLYVDGSIVNGNGESGPALFVKGQLIARNLVAGGSWICANGDAAIEECTCGYYNDGVLAIGGQLQTVLFINSDHHLEIEGKLIAEASFSTDAKRLPEDDNGDYLIPDEFRPLLMEDIVYWDHLLDLLRNGEYVLKDSKHVDGRSPREQAFYDAYVDKVVSGKLTQYYDLLKRVPPKYRTNDLCKRAIEFHPYNIAYAPRSALTYDLCLQAVQHKEASPNLTEQIPVEFRTRELCMLAAKNKAITIEALPEALLKDEELLFTIVQNWNYAYTSLPEEFKNKPAFKRFYKR